MPELMQSESVTRPGTELGTAHVRVMHILHRLATGGTEKNVLKLVQGLDAGVFEQTVCTVVRDAELAVNGARVVTLARPAAKPGLLVPHFVRLFRRERPDIVHARNWGTIEAVVAARLAGVPAVVYSEHGRDLQTMGRQPWRRRAFRRVCYRWADRVFAVSQELAEFYSAQLGVPREGLQVVPNGVDTNEFRPHPASRIEFRRRLAVSPETMVVGAVSRLDPVKDHVTLLRAAELAVNSGVDLCLAVVGDGVCRPALQKEAAARPALAGRVQFIGEVSDVAGWLNSFDVFALPSLSEGMSNTLLEAMAVGVPPVASRVGGNPELIEDGRSGILFHPGDAQALAECLRKLASAPEWRQQMGENSRQRVAARFSLIQMMQAYSQLYSEVLTRTGRRVPALSRI